MARAEQRAGVRPVGAVQEGGSGSAAWSAFPRRHMSGGPAASTWAPPRLARSAVVNFAGQAVPLMAGLFAIPVLIDRLGTSRFGVLTLAWMAVGYFSLFDLGLGRALTKLVAERAGTGDEGEIPALARTALLLMFAFGVLGAALGVALAPWVARDVLRVPAELRDETRSAFQLLAVSLPVVITSTGLRGLLEGLHRFGWVNAIRLPVGVFTFVGPLLVLPFTSSLVAVVAVLVAGRIVAWLAHAVCAGRAAPGLFGAARGDRRMLPMLLGFGGWMTVTNIVGPLMFYMDRLFIGAAISAAAVAYYATPYEVITKLWLIPGALLGVLFPAFSAGFRRDADWVRQTFEGAIEILLLMLFPAVLIIVLFAREGLTIWIDAEFAAHSARVARWLAAGVFVNSLALVPFNLIQGAGRPDLTARLHLIELPPYLLGLWWFTTRYGIEGAAMMWTLRASIDAFLLFIVAGRFVAARPQAMRRLLILAAAAGGALGVAAVPQALGIRLGYAALMLLATAVMAWSATRRRDGVWLRPGWSPRG